MDKKILFFGLLSILILLVSCTPDRERELRRIAEDLEREGAPAEVPGVEVAPAEEKLDPCSLLTPEEVEEVIRSEFADLYDDNLGSMIEFKKYGECNYGQEKLKYGGYIQVRVEDWYSTSQDALDYARWQFEAYPENQRSRLQEVRGLGDHAYILNNIGWDGSYVLYLTKGDKRVILTSVTSPEYIIQLGEIMVTKMD